MTAPPVEVLTAEDAQVRRAQVLSSLGVDEHELRRRAAEFRLDAHELAALDELDELDYLLSG